MRSLPDRRFRNYVLGLHKYEGADWSLSSRTCGRVYISAQYDWTSGMSFFLFSLQSITFLSIFRGFYWRMTIMKSRLQRVLSLFQLSTTAIVFGPISSLITSLIITILCPNTSVNGSGSRPTRHGTSTLFRYVVCNLHYFCF